MSEVALYTASKSNIKRHIRGRAIGTTDFIVVMASDFNAAQSELAAERLRADTAVADANDAERKLAALLEELALSKAETDGCRAANTVLREELKTERLRADASVGDANEAERRLTATEQRNAKLVAEIASLPDEFKSLSGSENTAGVYACIDYISEWVAEQTKPTESKVPSPKLCIECNKPYCHGVCVERGDELEPNE